MLLKDVFRDYHREARPVLNKEDAVKVELDIAYSQLVELVRKKCLYIAELHRVLCFDRSVVTLAFFQKNISYPTFPSLRFSALDQCFAFTHASRVTANTVFLVFFLASCVHVGGLI